MKTIVGPHLRWVNVTESPALQGLNGDILLYSLQDTSHPRCKQDISLSQAPMMMMTTMKAGWRDPRLKWARRLQRREDLYLRKGSM